MKRLIILMLVAVLAGSMFAAVSFESSASYIDINLSNSGDLELVEGSYYADIAFPARQVSLAILNSETEVFDSAGNFVARASLAEDQATVVESYVMRDLFLHRIRIEVESTRNGESFQLAEAVLRLQSASQIENVQTISSVFAPLYARMADNYQTSYLRNLQEMPAKMLIVSHSDLQNLSYFTDWKNEKGIATEVVMMSDLGSTVSDVKSYVQDQYDNEEHPPDYLLLIGDVNGAFTIPAYYHSSENDVTDHPYTLLDGDDYLPEMIVGRFSIDQQDDLNTIVSKVLNYEKTPYMGDPEWFERMVIVAGNYSDTPPIPSTPVTTSMWLAEKARDYGYEDITEIYYWPPEYPTYPGTTEISAGINNGAGIVTYRGWGNAWGWNFPYFHTENVQDLTNGFYLPIMTSVVCNTGDFANPNVDPCFGELWLTAGNNSNPKGGVVFMGPSDLHTSTRYNNALFAGFYQGLLDEGIHSFGAATLRGKTELYDNFPLNHGIGENVEFYYYVYNILGDPSLDIWTTTPQTMTCELPAEIDSGQNYLDIYVPETAKGLVTARMEDEFLVTEFIRDHEATVYFDAPAEGTIHVTITAVNRLPYTADVEITSGDIDPAVSAVVPQSEILAGEVVNVDITLSNNGTQSAEFNGVLEELTGMAEITDSNVDFGTLEAGASSMQTVQIEINGQCLNNWELGFELDFAELNKTIKFPLLVSNMVLMPQQMTIGDADGILSAGETADLTLSIANTGTLDVSGLSAVITSATDALVVNTDTYNVGDIASGAAGDAVFNLTASAGGYNGRDAGIYLHLEDASGRTYDTSFTITIGVVTAEDPTGPCPAGYYAYDDGDNYSAAPEYFWTEIDPALGGSGDVILMTDDQTESIPLPFEFTYYYAEYDSISISSNGWISFDTTWQTYFRNWRIPSALGPNAQVAAYWDDLIGPAGIEDMRVCYYYDSEEDIFIVEWSNSVNHEDDVSAEQFQIVLYNPQTYPTASGNGEIQINYAQVNNPDNDSNFCTVGIEDVHQEIGVLYTFANIYPASAAVLHNEMAIKFTTTPPDSYTDEDEDNLIPQTAVLGNNYPNPFNPVTTFSFSLAQSGLADLSVYNIKGKKVKTIVRQGLEAGDHSYIWHGDDDNGNKAASGVYFYQLKTGDFTTTKKCVLMK